MRNMFPKSKQRIDFKIPEREEMKSLESFKKLYKSTYNPNYYSLPKISDDELNPFHGNYSN